MGSRLGAKLRGRPEGSPPSTHPPRTERREGKRRWQSGEASPCLLCAACRTIPTAIGLCALVVIDDVGRVLAQLLGIDPLVRRSRVSEPSNLVLEATANQPITDDFFDLPLRIR